MNPGARQSLLLVDADPQSLRVLDVSLKKAGYDVVTAQSGVEALAVLAETPIDLVISDTHMPEMDGFELCRRIKERQDWARIPFIFLSSRKTIEDKIRGLEIGVEDYLIKPVYIKEITTRVRMLLQRRERERLESRRDTRTRFAGELSDIGIVDLVQTIEVNRKSGIVHIANTDGRRGAIYFRDGRVIDAEAGRLTGVEAVYRLFAWNDGSFEVEFKNIRRRDVIDLSGQALLMEGMRRLDEWTRLLDSLPPLETVFEVDYYVLAERLADIPDEVNTILRLLDGRRSLLQVIEDSDFPDLEAISIVGRLHADRVIYEALGDKPAHSEPRQTRMGRLERWLSESPWAKGEQRTPSPVKTSLAEEPSEERTTLTGFTTTDANEPLPVGRTSSTKPGMAVVAEELADLRSAPLGKTLHGFAPVRVTPTPERMESPAPTQSLDPDRTPSPLGMGAQPVQEMQGPDAADASESHESETASVEVNDSRAVEASPDEAVSEEPLGDETLEEEVPALKDADEPVTAQNTIDDDTRAALLEDGEQDRATDDDPLDQDDEATQDDEELAAFGAAASQQSDLATAEEIASLAEILGGQADDPTPVITYAALEQRQGEAKGASSISQDDPAHLTGEGEPFPDTPSASGGTALLDPNATSAPENLGDPPELKARRSGSARREGVDEPFVDEVPSNKGKVAIMFFMAVVVGGVVMSVVLKKPRGPSVKVEQVAAPTPMASAPSPAPSPPPALPPVDLPGTKAAASSTKVAAPAAASPAPPVAAKPTPPPVPAAKPPEPPAARSPTDVVASLDACKKAYASEKYQLIMNACGQALNDSPQEAQVMAMMAHAELDRGHSPAALKWAKKAVVADPKLADAYVFIGEVEQELGHKAAARAAYAKYLELAPTGKYASDLRIIVKNL